MNFRQLMKADISWRVIDLIGHCFLAWFLPGHWWYQFIPDIFVPFLFLHGMVTGKLLPLDSKLVWLNNFMHSWFIAILWLAFGTYVRSSVLITGARLYILPDSLFVPLQSMVCLTVHFMIHLLWDSGTHRKDWNKKRLSL